MKYIIFGLLICVSIYGFELESDIKKLKWVQDYEILVALDAKSNNSLIGIDSNQNGVRDDVEYLILQIYKNDQFQADMFLMSAKLIQDIFKLPNNVPTEIRERLDNDLIKIYTCRDYIIYKNSDSKTIQQELKNKQLIKNKILNTKMRLKVYIEHKSKLPFKLNQLTKDQLKIDKQNCNNIYQSYINNKEDQIPKNSLINSIISNIN